MAAESPPTLELSQYVSSDLSMSKFSAPSTDDNNSHSLLRHVSRESYRFAGLGLYAWSVAALECISNIDEHHDGTPHTFIAPYDSSIAPVHFKVLEQQSIIGLLPLLACFKL
jgi:hypothetical protein